MASGGVGQFARMALAMGGAMLLGATVVAWGGVAGDGSGFVVALMTAVERVVMCAWPGAVYLVSALGLGLGMFGLLRRLIGKPRNEADDSDLSLTAAIGVGLGLQLVLTLLGGRIGSVLTDSVSAGLSMLVGLVGLAGFAESRACRQLVSRHWAWRVIRDEEPDEGTKAARFALVIGSLVAGIVLASAASTPGVLWKSEFGGYDALSYHLQLPHEWMGAGTASGVAAANARVATVEHNVYSALPSGLEAAFAHVARLGFADDMLARDGFGLFAAQMLHAMIGIIAAFGVAGLARRVAKIAGCAESTTLVAAGLAGVLTLATPWVVVVSSLAYNEMGMVLGLAASGVVLVQCWERLNSLNPNDGVARRALAMRVAALLAIIVGGACASKPTALLFVGVPVGLVLLVMSPGKRWERARWEWLGLLAAVGSVVGLAMLAPWMVRNWMATGNPVFPFAAGVFARADGSMGWWSGEQIARFAASHRFEGSVLDRVKLMFIADASDPATGGTHRGLLHAQWGPWLALSCVVGMVVMPGLAMVSVAKARRIVGSPALWMVLGMVMLAQLWMWLRLTHVQSRFLLPMVVPMAVVLGVSAAMGFAWLAQRRGGRSAFLGAMAVTLGTLMWLLVSTRAMGLTNIGLLFSPGDRMGVSPAARGLAEQDKTSEQFVNTMLSGGDRVLLVGEATPLYYDAKRIAYTTTWDTNPLAELLAQESNDATVTRLLRERGFTHLLINFAELDRLKRSGFLDPRLDVERVARIARSQALVRAWDQTGQVLVRLER